MADRTDMGAPRLDEPTDVDPTREHKPRVSRIDTLSKEFTDRLSRRPHVIGDIIAERYKLVQKLGDGGMGQVFIAENLVIARRVAIKVLKPELLEDLSFRGRFQREAQAIAAIEHRNVARFFDLIVGDPTFLVMEYVPGPTLSAVLKKEERLKVARAVSIARRLCWALDAAHRAGVVHRDIKPLNVIMTPDPEMGDEPKLIDFGLAKLASHLTSKSLTRAGQLVGTPHYMAPEQIANKGVDARSDIYALGCMLYELVVGQPPFAGIDDVQVLYQQIEREPAPLHTHMPNAPKALDALIARAMAKSPEARFGSMVEMAEALAELDEQRPAAAASRKKKSPWPRIMRAAAFGATALLLGTVVGSVATKRRLNRAPVGGAILVSSRPAGAAVEIDGQPVLESTPTALRGLAPGKHAVRLHAQGYGPIEQVVSLATDERSAVDVVLPPLTRALEVQTVPAGALVYLDGQLAPGHTPLTVSITEDDFHELRMEKSGYEPSVRALKPEEHQKQLTVYLQPEKQDRGTVWVDSNRTAQVFLDGGDSGFTTPTGGLQLSVGKHVVELRDQQGALGASARVNVIKGDVVHLTLEFANGPRAEKKR